MLRNRVGATIGVMAVGLASYWRQFPGMREQLLGHYEQLASKFGADCTVIRAGMVDTAQAAREAGQLFRVHDVDLVFCQLTTYANSETLLPAIRELYVPVILLNVQSVKRLEMEQVKTLHDWLGAGITCAALPEMTAALRRMEKRCAIVSGYMHGDGEVDAALADWSAAAAVTRRLRKQNLALLGRPFAGMMDLNVDETALFKVFGTYVHHLQWDDIVDEAEQVADDDAETAAGLLTACFDMPAHLSAQELLGMSRLLCGVMRLAEQYELCGLPNHYEGALQARHTELLAAWNPVLSVLNGLGIACPVEADIKAAVAMVILKQLAGSATLAELYSLDYELDQCIIGHSGAGDPAISAAKPKLTMSDVFHGKSGKGYVTQFYPQEGAVTLFSLTQDGDGRYRMVAAEGECVSGPPLDLGDTNCRVRFAIGLRAFVDRWSSLGPTHHGVLGLGRHTATLRKMAVMLDIPLDIVCV
ncbi:sugar isomerase [Paenibacillus cymbidii]|uniref:sugar isomerase n=1 Tax=Paenibacillus cymbidii TaxID=1639034 RepID=UPI001080035A|nr:sugar isomerase [Paenibacillus cymbidii]